MQLGPRLRRLTLSLAMAVPFNAQAWDFSAIMGRSQSLYDPSSSAVKRLTKWNELIQDETHSDTDEKLEAVNRFFNRHLRFETDQQIWGELDYWATPVESLVTGAADCEDFTIAKYHTLRHLGVPDEQMRLTYVKANELNQPHMVLSYYATPGSEPLVLDNLTDWIRPASQRQDLLPVYSFNAAGLWPAGSTRNTMSGPARQLPRWRDLLEKMRDEGFTEPRSLQDEE